MKQLYFLFFAFSMGFAQVPKVWWVDVTNGNDNNNGQSEATAFKSIKTLFTNNLTIQSMSRKVLMILKMQRCNPVLGL